MCDQTEVPYLPDDVVWVKLGPVWWPGRVCKEDEIPPEIIKDLRKTPIAIVKFFQEDSFEYVKNLSSIYHYNCLRKNEFIKKGLDMLRSKNRDAPSNMKLFPEDIVRAECLTGGNPKILQDDMFMPEEKPTYADLFATNKRASKKLKLEVKKKQTPVKQNTPRLITHPRFLQLSSGHSTDYEVRERKQEPIRAECDEEDTSPPTYHCTECEYTTTRLNVMIWHNKSHTRNYASSQVPNKAPKRKSTASVKLKERSSTGATVASSTNIEFKEDGAVVAPAKIPKTNGTLKARSPKTPGRKKMTSAKNVSLLGTHDTKEPKSVLPVSAVNAPIQKRKRITAPKSDEFQKSLLEDWLEDEIEQDTDEKPPASGDDDLVEKTALENSSYTRDDSSAANDDASLKGKSCFDFDDSEDHLIIDKSKFKLGRKIPRLLDGVKNGRKNSAVSSLAPDDVVAIQKSPIPVDVGDTTPKYHTGIEEDAANEVQRQNSHLQDMGVDNEIEIKTEETSVDEIPVLGNNHLNPVTKIKSEDASELHDKVDKLLAEVSKPSLKLPEIPRSHKKAHLKAYCESLEYQQAAAEEEAAKKAAAEEQAAKKIVAEKDATENSGGAKETAADDKQMPAFENFHPETIDIEVSNIPLPSPQKHSVTTETVKSSSHNGDAISVAAKADISIDFCSISSTQPVVEGTVKSEETLVDDHTNDCSTDVTALVDAAQPAYNVTVADNSTPFEEPSEHPPPPSTTHSVSSEESASHVMSQSEAGSMTATIAAAAGQRSALKFTTTPKLKQINTTQLLGSGQRTFKIINPTDENYKTLINKINASAAASASQISPKNMSSGEPLKTIKTTLKMADGKSVVYNLSAPSSKNLLTNTLSSGSPTKIILLNCKKNIAAGQATPAAGNTPTQSGRTINLANATAVRLTPNILQKTAAQKATAALAKSTGKNIVLDASTFQTLLQSQPQMCKPTSQLMLPEVVSEASTSQVATPSGNAVTSTPSGVTPLPVLANQPGIVYVADHGTQTNASSNSIRSSSGSGSAGQTVDFIVDSSGNLIQVNDEVNATEPTTPSKDKDILAKALENTDGLQTEMALTNATNSVLDSCNVAQNTEMTYKTDALYENLTLNTPPIMSPYEMPSRTVAAVNVLPETSSNEVVVVASSAESTEYVT